MSQPTFIQKLWERKVPQLLGTYLAVGFGVLQFVEFISQRFSLSDYWVDAYLLLWLMLLPAVALLAYYAGLPPATKGEGWKRWLIYGNLVLAFLLLFLIPGGDAAPATQVVVTTDESGATKERIIPAASAVQRIGIFEMRNAEDDPDKDWWGTGYALLLQDDLRQRPEVIIKGVRSLNQRYKKYEVPLFGRVNLATQRKIAERANTDYFIRAEYRIKDDTHEIFGGLYRTRDGEKVRTLETTSYDPFTAIDDLKDQIEAFLPPPIIVDQEALKLPVSALITDSEEALESYTKGIIAFSLNPGDLPPSVAHFRKAVAKDPSCASCFYELADKLYGLGKADSSLILLTRATKLAEVLPEREQFGYRSTLLRVAGQTENHNRLLESVKALYPYEYWPYAFLESHYENSYGIDSAIVLMSQAAALSDRETALTRLYRLYLRAKQFDKAEETIKDLEKEYDSGKETRRRYAELYEKSGQIEKARETLKDMMATDPTNLELPAQLAILEINTGHFESGERILNDIFRRATSRSDSTNAWNYLIRVYAESGRIRKALEELEAYEVYISQDAPVNVILAQDFLTKVDYASRLDDPFPIISKSQEALKDYDSHYINMLDCYAIISLVTKEVEVVGGSEKLEDCQEAIISMGLGVTDLYELAKLILSKDYEAAADHIDQRLANGMEGFSVEASARIQRKAGRLDRALELLEGMLKLRPNAPELLLEKVRIFHDQGNIEGIKEPLRSVLDSWREADPDHTGYQEAKALAESLG